MNRSYAMPLGWRRIRCQVCDIDISVVTATLTVYVGLYEFIKKGDAPVMGVTKLKADISEEELRRPRKKLPGEEKAGKIPSAAEASHLPSNNPGPASPAGNSALSN